MNDEPTKKEPSHHERKGECPYCFYESEACANVDNKDPRKPGPGSISLCLRCGQWSTFNERLDLERMTEEEWESIDAETKQMLLRTHKHWKAVVKPQMDAKYGKTNYESGTNRSADS